MAIKVLGIAGSLRQNSFNKNLIHAVLALAPEGVEMEIVDIKDIPLFNQDLEQDMPEPVRVFKEKIKAADAVVFATPEYNRSIPGVLKNAVDWASRPRGENAWSKKFAATMGATDGAVGTAVAQSHLRELLVVVGTRVMGQPEFYMTGAASKFDAQGDLTDEATKAQIAKFWNAFVPFIGRD